MLLGLGLVLRLATIAEDPLHPDECLYASWAAAVWPGGDLLLRGELLDKPPLFPYLLMGWSQLIGPGPVALRLLGAASALVSLSVIFRIARAAAGDWAGLAALCLAALSPAAVALDATAFVDPPALALALVAVALSQRGRPVAAGVLLGLAVATKPTAIAFVPLVLLLGAPRGGRAWLRCLAGAAAVGVAVLAWEWLRSPEVGFVTAALGHYGVGMPGRFDAEQWAALLRWVVGRAEVGVVLALVALAGVLASGRRWSAAAALLVGSLGSALFYLGLQVVLAAPAWDRYLVPLAPMAALALAGGLAAVAERAPRLRPWLGGVASLMLAILLFGPAREAALGRLPLGDTSAWQGIGTVAAYVRGQVPGRATVMYRDLGWHIRYYMDDFPQDFVWYQEPASLVAAAARAEPLLMMALAGDRADEDVAMLRRAGFSVSTRLTTYRHDGAPALVLYLVSKEEP